MGRRPKDRNEILLVAMDLLDEVGLRNFQLKQVAQRMAMRPPSLYNHFEGMSGLLREIQIISNNLLLEKMLEARGETQGAEALKAMAFGLRDFSVEHPGLYEVLTDDVDFEDQEVYASYIKTVAPLTQCLPQLNMNDSEGVHLMRFLRSSLHGFISLQLRGNIGIEMADLDDSYGRLVDMVLSTITNQVQTQHNRLGKNERVSNQV